MKPFALAGMAMVAFAGFVHWITVGPNEVQPEDETEGRRTIGEK
jgi:formate dehydrogenase iron-sulfur subunit